MVSLRLGFNFATKGESKEGSTARGLENGRSGEWVDWFTLGTRCIFYSLLYTCRTSQLVSGNASIEYDCTPLTTHPLSAHPTTTHP